MKILIVGAGSVGVYLGTLLFANKNEVTLLGEDKLKNILSDNILIEGISYILPMRIYKMPQNSSYDFIFITSKLYDLERNLNELIKNKVSTKYLASIQNGIVDESLYKPYIKLSRFASICVFEGFRLTQTDLIVSSNSKGEWKTENTPEGTAIANLLKKSGINCNLTENIESIKAEKTIMNSCTNLLSAIEKKTLSELSKNEKTKQIMNTLFDESYEVFSEYIKLKPKEELRKLFFNIISPMEHYSSTYQDAIIKQKSEAKFLNGLIIELGKKYKIKTPENKRVLNQFVKMYPDSV
jgi:2-dehydropantoate 2-reductase